MVCSPDGITNFFNIVTEALQGDTLVSYIFIICQDHVLQMSIHLIKENGFRLKKTRRSQWPTETKTDADDI